MRRAILALVLAWPASAAAQSARQGANIDLQAFRPAIDSRGLVTLNASQVLGHHELSFGLVTNWGRNVLRFERDGESYEVTDIVTPTLVAAYGLRRGRFELELGASLPFSIVAGDRGPDDDGGTVPPNDDRNFRFEGQGLGDVGLHAKARLLATSRAPHIGLAVVGSVFLPTATEHRAWIGDDAANARATVVLDRQWADGRLHGVVNVGLRYRPRTISFTDDAAGRLMDPRMPATGETLAVGSTMPYGAGMAYAVSKERIDVVAELFGELPLAGENYLPLEVIGGVKLYLARNSFLTLGGGAGLVAAAGGNPDLRAFMGIVFEPRTGDRDGDGLADDLDGCPDDPEDHDDFEDRDGCPDPDNDRDRIYDVDDRCPNQPEDRDGVDDDDGCPETDPVDRDGDRIVDDLDRCPDDPEDYDDWQDDDGCPDPDNDVDTLLDVDDLCPDTPEDHDDWEDGDGCPDPDNDRDRILDVDDDCRNEPEVYNGYLDEDGCPDRDPVADVGGELVIFDEIHFEYDQAIIKEESFPILDAVGYTLEHNPDIQRVEVQGHTDERGSDAYNLDLSQRRAEAVVEYLERYGVAASRLRPRGYGEREPVDPGHDEQAWARNRRVEFIILQRD